MSSGADMTRRPNNGNSLMHLAAVGGSEACCKMLLQCGLDINQLNGDSNTPLFCAVQTKQVCVSQVCVCVCVTGVCVSQVCVSHVCVCHRCVCVCHRSVCVIGLCHRCVCHRWMCHRWMCVTGVLRVERKAIECTSMLV